MLGKRILGVPEYIWRRLCMVNLAVIVLLGSIGFALPQAGAEAVNCDSNAVINCGGSTSQLASKYSHGDGRNTAASIQHIYSFFGISASDMNSLSTAGQEGSVTKSGDVFLNGNLVANSAITAGRSCAPGGTPHNVMGTGFCSRAPSVNFLSNSLSAVVVMRNGVFQFAILHSCGNPVTGHPTTMPPKPKPTPPPKPTPTPAPTPRKTVVKKTVVNKNTVKKTTTTVKQNVCSGNTHNSNTHNAAQGGNCSTNVNVVQNTTNNTTNNSPPPSSTTTTSSAEETSTPSELVNTGPASLATFGAIFVAVSTIGTIGYQRWLRRRLSVTSIS